MIHIDYDSGRKARQSALLRVMQQANDKLTPGTVFEIRAKPYPRAEGMLTDFGRVRISRDQMAEGWGCDWLEIKDEPRLPLFMRDIDDGEWLEHAGCFCIGRQVALGGANGQPR